MYHTWKDIYKNILTTAGIMAASMIAGTVLLCLVFMLPANLMRQHVAGDVELLQEEGDYTVFWKDVFVRMHPGDINARTFFLNNRGMARDNHTDALMLGCAVYQHDSRGVLDRALSIYYYDENKATIESLEGYIEGRETGSIASYPRYWHGYLVVLKPLLCLLTYSQIRILNMIVQACLLLLLCREIVKRIGGKYLAGFLGGVAIVFPFVIPLCMQYSTVVYVTLISAVIYLQHAEYWHDKERSLYLFLLTGIVTSYVDFLTYPVMTLGTLLVFGMLMSGGKAGYILKHSLMWCVGYFGMWFGKWGIATLVLKQDIIADGLSQAAYRTSAETDTLSGEISAVKAVLANFSSITNIYDILALMILLAVLLGIVVKAGGIRFGNLFAQRCYLLVACYPLIWYAVLKNHSYDHSSFTYRALFVTVFAIASMIIRSSEKEID